MAICDRCNTSIPRCGGYVMYCEASAQIFGGAAAAGRSTEIGCLLLCEKCTTSIYNESSFSRQQPAAVGIDPSRGDLQTQIREALRITIDASLITIAKRQGLAPQEALTQARGLAQEWWTNNQAAARKAMALAKQAPRRMPATPEALVREQPSHKKWWQF